MRHKLIEEFMNVMEKNVYYINDKDGYSYQMRLLIYDAKFKMEEKKTQSWHGSPFMILNQLSLWKSPYFHWCGKANSPVFGYG